MDLKETNSLIKKKSPRIIVGALFILVFLLGWILGHQDSQFGRIGFTPNIVGKDATGQNIDFSIFWRTWDLLVERFDGKVDYEKMVYGAVKGMVDALGDPYTSFLTPSEAAALEDDLSGVVSGIGAEIGFKNGSLTIIAPLDDSPAKAAGILSGDKILAINGELTTGMNINTAVGKIRGDAGTKVKLILMRGTAEKEYEIVRARVTVKSVKSEIKEGNIGYVSISRFDNSTTDDLVVVLDSFIAKNTKKIIIDLRDNPGGYLDESVTVASQFIGSGVIVAEKKDVIGGRKQEYKAQPGGKMTGSDIKIIVLINGGSASASEIVAGALRDTGRATLVGEKTFGKGSVQEIEDLSRGAKLRVTIAHWYTPSGKNISKEGITPDVEIVMTEDDYNNDRDPQLQKALLLFK
jgi:carboxyl-terminal processing protease